MPCSRTGISLNLHRPFASNVSSHEMTTTGENATMSGHDTDINVRSKDVIERILSMELVRVTERAAVVGCPPAWPWQ